MTLQDAVRFFTEESGTMACLHAACGSLTELHTAMGGVRDAAGAPLAADSIFDLASLTKLFTGLTVYRLWEEGLLDLNARVTDYDARFVNLAGVTVDQLLGFEVALSTPGRLDAQPDRANALPLLWQIAPGENGRRPYSDMHAMVLKYVIESAAGEGWLEAVAGRILRPLGMKNTWVRVPEEQRYRCVSCDREHRLVQGRHILREGIAPGTPHDPKARLLNPDGEDCCGHAGMFSTMEDMVRLCRGILSGAVIGRESLRRMSRNRTGHPLPEGGWSQFLGSQCYVKHPDQYFSEVPAYMGPSAIALSGFTGHHLSVDPEQGIFALFLGNRVLNRLTFLIPEEGKEITDYGLNPDGTGRYLWPDGEWVRSSVHYVHLKDGHFHPAVAETMKL